MSSILKDERILLRKINRSRLDAGYKVSTFFSFSTNFFPPPTHSQVDRCRDVKLIFAGKGVGETLNILVHRRSMGARERRRFIIRRDRMEKRILCHRFPPFSFTLVSRPEKGGHEDRSIRRAGRITCQRAAQTDIRSSKKKHFAYPVVDVS